jgi:membrane protein involved in colicin uptake
VGSRTDVSVEQIGMFYGLGAAIILLAAMAAGRFSVIGVRDVAVASAHAERAAAERAAAERALAERAAAERATADRAAADTTTYPAGTHAGAAGTAAATERLVAAEGPDATQIGEPVDLREGTVGESRVQHGETVGNEVPETTTGTHRRRFVFR